MELYWQGQSQTNLYAQVWFLGCNPLDQNTNKVTNLFKQLWIPLWTPSSCPEPIRSKFCLNITYIFTSFIGEKNATLQAGLVTLVESKFDRLPDFDFCAHSLVPFPPQSHHWSSTSHISPLHMMLFQDLCYIFPINWHLKPSSLSQPAWRCLIW